MSARPFSPQTLADRIAPVIARGSKSACWPWKGPVLRSGYGNAGSWFQRNVGTLLAHRIAYLAANGSLPEKPLILRHTCDNRLCCNPGHLKPGTYTDNMRDMVARGRSTKGQPFRKGQAHPRAKISDEAVLSVRQMHANGLSNRAIADAVGVSHTQVARILRGESRGAVNV